jgi:hypothetical protein
MTASHRLVLAFAILSALGTGPAWAETHIFTTTDGRFIRGELVNGADNQAILRTTDGKIQNLSLSELIGADQDYIATHAKAAAPEVPHNFEVIWTKEKTNSNTKGKNHAKVTTSTYVTHINLRNLSNQPTGDMALNYQLYYVAAEGRQTELKHKDGVIKLPSLGPLGTAKVDTEPFELESSDLAGNFYYTSGAQSRQMDSFKGIVVDFMQDGKQVFEYVAPGVTRAPK